MLRKIIFQGANPPSQTPFPLLFSTSFFLLWFFSLLHCCLFTLLAHFYQGRSNGAVYRYIYPPKIRPIKLLWSNNDRTVIEQGVLKFYTAPKKFLAMPLIFTPFPRGEQTPLSIPGCQCLRCRYQRVTDDVAAWMKFFHCFYSQS